MDEAKTNVSQGLGLVQVLLLAEIAKHPEAAYAARLRERIDKLLGRRTHSSQVTTALQRMQDKKAVTSHKASRIGFDVPMQRYYELAPKGWEALNAVREAMKGVPE